MSLRYNTRYRITLYYNNQVWMQFYNDYPGFNIDFDCNIMKDAFTQGQCRSSCFIYNLSPDKRKLIDSLISQGQQKSMHFMLEASTSYQEDRYKLVSYDDVVGAYNEIGQPDFKTNFILKSGESQLSDVYSSASYAAGTKLSAIVSTECQKLVDNESIKTVNTTGLLDYTFPYGAAYQGNTGDFLKKLCQETNNTFFVDKGTVYASQNNYQSGTSSSITLDFSNGLLEPPHPSQTNFRNRKNKNQGFVSFQFKSLLLPDIEINQIINVLNVNYTIKRINHCIQSRQGVAYTIVEGYRNGSV